MRRAIPIAIALTCLAAAAGAGTVHVPGDYVRIGTALLFVPAGDTVLVAPGTYRENLNWPKRQGITLLSEAGAAATTLDGGGGDTVVNIAQPVDSTTRIRGFTITNGWTAGA
ncbi:MAG: hypothetical protein JW819_10525 [Candidatus Krumholzibacteriota bacterium]|nr:hypothetical protein [Candidatus Krumholzibacteriota bacterium]